MFFSNPLFALGRYISTFLPFLSYPIASNLTPPNSLIDDSFALVFENVGVLPLVLLPPFLVSPLFFWSALFLLTKDALPSGPSFAAFSFDKQAAYASPSLPSPHLPNFLPSELYLSQPPPSVEPVLPLPNQLRRSSCISNWPDVSTFTQPPL